MASPFQLHADEPVPELAGEGLEAGAGGRVLAIANTQHGATVARPTLDRGRARGARVRAPPRGPADREGRGRLGDDGRRHRVVDHHGQRETAGEAHAEGADTRSAEL